MVSKPKVPEVRYPDPPPPVPERSSADTAALADAQRREMFTKGGRAMTMLTGGQGTGGGSGAIRFLGSNGGA